MWSLKRTVAPTQLAVTLDEAKDHLRVDSTDEDSLLFGYIRAAIDHVETITGRALCTQTWTLTLDRWPSAPGEILLPRAPLSSVTSIKYTDASDVESTLATTVYEVDTAAEPGRVALSYNQTWPAATLKESAPIVITYVAGYGDPDDVPETYKHAIKLLVGHWFLNREAITDRRLASTPAAFESLIASDAVRYVAPW